jgi:hypothetical protein
MPRCGEAAPSGLKTLIDQDVARLLSFPMVNVAAGVSGRPETGRANQRGRGVVKELKDLDVHFGCGDDVLNAYWGYLAGGGLVLGDTDLEEGQEVILHLRVGDAGAEDLDARVVRRDPEHHTTHVKLTPGDSHTRLLAVMLAGQDDEDDVRGWAPA